jgi:anaerobic dimethyl sulfoxide reductase subunit B (iron-sulfur subunit)
MSAYGLLIDYEWCTGCHTCEVACQVEHGLPYDQWGIKLFEVGPWEYAPKTWQYAYLPVPTNQCDLCENRVAKGHTPTCVKHCQAKCLKYGKVEDLAKELANKPKQTLFSL